MADCRHLRLGEIGEELAANHLRRMGLRILGRRVRFRRGELDIVAKDGREWVFVEVKTRSGTRMGSAAEAFTSKKLGRLARAAREYIQQYNLHDKPMRCDLIAIDIDSTGKPKITHYPNAATLG